MTLSRRRLLALGLVAPFVATWPFPAAAAAAPALRALVRAGIQRDAACSLLTIFGLTPDIADDVLMRVTRDDALPDNYSPGDLVDAAAQGLPTAGQQRLRRLIVDDSRALFEAAASEGLDLYVGSGFRSQT